MNEIQKKSQEARRLISIIPVSGDAVDVMAAARIQLAGAIDAAGDKSALWEAHKMAEKEEQDG